MIPSSRLLAAGLALCALGLLGWAGVRAVAMFTAPSPVVDRATQARSAPDLRAARVTLAKSELFGSPAPPEKVAEAPQPQAKLRLIGVYAAPGRDSYAVLVVDNGKPEVSVAGREIRPGLVLHEVRADHAVVRRQGKLERLELPASQAAK